MNFIRVLLAVLCFCVPGFSQAPSNTIRPPREAPAIKPVELAQKVDIYLQDLLAKDDFSGVVLLAKDGAPAFQKALGLQSKEYGVSNNMDTKFNIGSIDKVFTKIAIGQLLEQGKITSIDDKLEKYLPDYPNHEAASTVTLRQILNMQSGIGDFFGPEFFASSKDAYRAISDYFPLFASKPLAFTPGTNRQYSNGGYVVLGAVIEKVSGKNYYDYVRDNIFIPLGMENSAFYEGDIPIANLASGYTREHGNENAPRRNNVYTRPARGSSAGGGYSTAGDLLKFANAVNSGKIKNPNFEENAPKPPDAPFALMPGVRIAGGAPGLNAVLESDLPGGYTIVVLSNYDPPSAEEIPRKIHEWIGMRDVPN